MTARVPALTWPDARCDRHRGGLRFVLPVLESTNRIWRQHKGRTLKSRTGRENTKAAATVFAGVRPITGDVAVAITWYRARKSGDIDNRTKAVLDALRGIAYPDDKAIAQLTIARIDDPAQPARLEVVVLPLSPARQAA